MRHLAFLHGPPAQRGKLLGETSKFSAPDHQVDMPGKAGVITIAMGADSRLFDAAVASGARGIVLETFGRGNATPQLVAAVK